METFCCCIPVRFGVFVLSILTAILGGFLSAASWVQYTKLNASSDTEQRVILIVSGVVYGVLALFSLFGFFGSIIASRPLVKSYSVILWINWLLSLAAGGLAIWQLFRAGSLDSVIQQCQTATGDNSDDCQNAYKVIRIVYIVVFAVVELIVLYTCIIVNRYVDQLRQEEMYDGVKRMERAIVNQPAPVIIQQPVYPAGPLYTQLPGGSTAQVGRPY